MVADWCDDERNVHVFLRYEPQEKEIVNIYKDVADHLKKTARESAVNDIEYRVYEYEPLVVHGPEDESDDGGSDTEDVANANEVNEVLLDHNFTAYT